MKREYPFQQTPTSPTNPSPPPQEQQQQQQQQQSAYRAPAHAFSQMIHRYHPQPQYTAPRPYFTTQPTTAPVDHQVHYQQQQQQLIPQHQPVMNSYPFQQQSFYMHNRADMAQRGDHASISSSTSSLSPLNTELDNDNISSMKSTNRTPNTRSNENDEESGVDVEEEEMEGEESTKSQQSKKKNRRVRKVSKLACVHCRKAHTGCSETRPCNRCLEMGLECIDVQGKKRGRKRKEEKAKQEGEEYSPAKPRGKRAKSIVPKSEASTATAETDITQEVSVSGSESSTSTSISSSSTPISTQLQTDMGDMLNPIDDTAMAQHELQAHLETLQQLTSITPQIPNELTSILFSTPDQWVINNSNIMNSIMSTHGMYDMGTHSTSPGLLSDAADTGNNNNNSSNSMVDSSGTSYSYNENDINNYLLSSLIDTRHVKPSLASSIESDIDFPGLSNMDETFHGASTFDTTDNSVPDQSRTGTSYTVIDQVSSLDQHVQQDVQSPVKKESTNETETEAETDTDKQEKMASVSQDVRKLVQESFGIIQDVQQEEGNARSDKGPTSYMEFLNSEFPKSLLIRRRINNSLQGTNEQQRNNSPNAPTGTSSSSSLPTTENSTSSTDGTVPNGYVSQETYLSMKHKMEGLQGLAARKSNEVAILVAVNEQLRSAVVDILSRRKDSQKTQRERTNSISSTSSTSETAPSSQISAPSTTKAKEKQPAHPLNTPTKPAPKSTSAEASFQELLSLIQSEKEMESRTYGMMVTFPGGRIVSLNKKVLTVLGYDSHDVFATLSRWEDVVAPSSYGTIVKGIVTCLRQPPAAKRTFRANIQCRKKDNTTIDSEVFTSIVGSKNSFIPIFTISHIKFKE